MGMIDPVRLPRDPDLARELVLSQRSKEAPTPIHLFENQGRWPGFIWRWHGERLISCGRLTPKGIPHAPLMARALERVVGEK